jgi:hypothetical protein
MGAVITPISLPLAYLLANLSTRRGNLLMILVVVTLFVAGPGQVTLPRQMFSGIREDLSPTIAAAATADRLRWRCCWSRNGCAGAASG